MNTLSLANELAELAIISYFAHLTKKEEVNQIHFLLI